MEKNAFMRYLVFYLLIVLNPALLLSQTKEVVTLNSNNIRLYDLFIEIEKQTSYTFAYDNTKIDLDKVLSIDVTNASIERILETIFSNTTIFYKVSGSHIMLAHVASENDSQPSTEAFLVLGRIVSNLTQMPLPGATVIEYGTGNGTYTDDDGRFSLVVSSGESVLEVSSIGHNRKEVRIDNTPDLQIELEFLLLEIDEVVVIGYGTQHKDYLTGSVSIISSEALNRNRSSTIDRAMQGKASGILVHNTSGDPNSVPSVMIRGIGSINRSTEPLYVIDNVPVEGIRDINPEDIESVHILKDASATAIYGARGANGVVMIKTKRGRNIDKLSVDYASYVKTSDFPGSRWYDVMDANEYVEFTRLAHESNPRSNTPPIIASDSLREAYGDINTNWQEELFRLGVGQNQYLRVMGGGNNHNYSVSTNYYNEKGVMINSEVERFNIRINSDFSLFDGLLTLGESLLLGQSTDQGSIGGNGNRWVVATTTSPLMPIYEPRNIGGYAGPTDSISGNNDSTNPVAEQMMRSISNYDTRFLANYYIQINPFNNLSYKLNIGNEIGTGRRTIWLPELELGNIGNRSRPFSELTERSAHFNRLLLENLLDYNQTIKYHSITLLLGHTIQMDVFEEIMAVGQRFRGTEHNVLSQAEIASNVTGTITEHKIESYLARAIYDYRGKYLLTASFRRDGSSRFGKLGQRYGNFPSVSAGWVINRDFLREVTEINMLKLRFGWGHTGNMNIGDYAYESLLLRPDASRYLFGTDETLHLGATDLRSTGNPRIKWEQAEMTNIGVDLRGFSNRLNLSAEYYIKNQHDMLVRIATPLIYGKDFDDPNSNPWVNLGKVQNKGFEFSATLLNQFGNFFYSLSANLTTINNTVIELPNGNPIFTSHSVTAEGHSIGSFYGFKADGIFQSQEEVNEHANQGSTSPGDIRFKDINHDGIINDMDKTIIGKPTPDFTYGLKAEFGHRGLDLYIFLNGMHNLDVYNEHRANIGIATDRNGKDYNKLRETMNFWTPDNQSTTMTRISNRDGNNNARISSWFVEDASFLRLQSVQVGYTLPNAPTNRLGMNRVRFYISGTNLHVFTKYSGYDPEIGSLNVLEMGLDIGVYPIPRSFIFGVQISI